MTQITLTNATLVPCTGDRENRAFRGWIRIENGRIAALGEGEAEGEGEDLGGRLVTPALVDCHTHIVYGGSRAREFEQRLEGVSYEDIARSGGGILSTVNATREASEEDLVATALPRLDTLLSEGAAVVEVKSGYGLTIEDEIKMLRAARRLETLRDVRIKTTWLAAHALPPETKAAHSLSRNEAGFRPITSNIQQRRMPRHLPKPVASQSCSPVRSIHCAKRKCRRLQPFARRDVRWRWPRIAIREPRR